MSTQSDFDAKVAFVKSWTYGGSKVTNAEKLACYGLFKQVTVGDNTTPNPGPCKSRRAPSGTAWASRKRMSKPDAIAAYIAEVDSQHAKYGDGPGACRCLSLLCLWLRLLLLRRLLGRRRRRLRRF